MMTLIPLFIVFSFSSSNAALLCKQLFLDAGKGVNITNQPNAVQPSELNLTARSFEATGNPKQISQEVSDLILMMAQARTPIVSEKEINEKGKLVLGLPIGNGFVLELKYRSNSTFENKFVLDHINLLSPSGKQIDVSANPIDIYDDRKISKERVNFEVGTYPDGYNINATIPTLIKGDVLKEIQQLTPKLELLPKDVLRELAKESNLQNLKKKANRAHMKYFIKRYSIRGVFKTLFKIVVYEPLKMLATVAIVYVAMTTSGNSPSNITEFFMPKTNNEWVAKSINDSINSETMPALVKKQLKNLQSQISENPALVSRELENAAIDQNATKYQFSKSQYLWTTTLTDKESGKTETIIFISRDNGKGQINYAALRINPEHFKELIAHIRQIGQFIPVSPEDLK